MRLKGMWAGNTPYSKFIILVGLVMVVSGIVMIPVSFTIQPLFGIDPSKGPGVLSDYDNPVVVQALKYLQMFQAISMFILPPLLMAYLVGDSVPGYLGIRRRPALLTSLLVIAAALAVIPFVDWMLHVNQQMQLPTSLARLQQWIVEKEEVLGKVSEAFIRMDSYGDLFYTLLVVALIPAVGEEFLLRGVVQRLFTEWTRNVHVAILLSALLFSAIHVQFLGFLPRMMLGMFLGYLFAWSGNLWLSVLAHFVNNASVVLYHFFFPDSAAGDTAGATPAGYAVLLSIAVFSALSWLIYRRERAALSGSLQ
jgi:uncharacterized protein